MIQLGAAIAIGYFAGPKAIDMMIASKSSGSITASVTQTVAPQFYGQQVAKVHADYDAIASVAIGAVAYFILGKVF
jgi:hypothetical protein